MSQQDRLDELNVVERPLLRQLDEAKRFGIVVDYYGVGTNLADALALYDGEDRDELNEGIGKAEDLLPELHQARDVVVKLFADRGVIRGSTLQPYVDECVATLRDQKLRAEFLIIAKKFLGLFDDLMPRPEARAFSLDAKLYAFIAKAASNLYRDYSLDLRGVARKVQAMLDAYIAAHGIDPTIPPIDILDPNFAAEVAGKTSDRAKAADMEHALRHHISISFEKDPAQYKSLSDRLEGVLAQHQADWRVLVQLLQQLIDEALAATTQGYGHSGLDPLTEAPLFGILQMRLGSGDRDGDIAQVAIDLAHHLREKAMVQGFWDNAVEQEMVRRWAVRRLDDANLYPLSNLDAIAADCMGVARANRAAYGQ